MNSNKVNKVLAEIAYWSEEERVLLIEKLKGEADKAIDKATEPFNPKDKIDLLNKLCGAWTDTSDNLAKEILESRTISDKNLSLD